jgi:hypothetical protein
MEVVEDLVVRQAVLEGYHQLLMDQEVLEVLLEAVVVLHILLLIQVVQVVVVQ